MSHFFRTTHWTQVLASRGETPEARQALSDLCAVYYEPVLAFVRQSGHDPDSARDLVHEFFAGLLERQGLKGADPARGRFRTYLLGAVKHFLANKRAAEWRLKRGAGARHEPMEVGTDTAPGLEFPDPASLPSDALFDREWALRLLDHALACLGEEATRAGNHESFEKLKPWLVGSRPDLSQSQVGRELAMSDGAVRVAIHRLRRRFRELVKEQIAQTLDNPAEVEQELAYLLSVLT